MKDKKFSVADFIIYAVVILAAIVCVIPFINVIAISFSSGRIVSAGEVGLLPKEFTLDAYRYVADKPEFLRALWVSIKRVIIGVPINMILMIMVAYPLSKTSAEFKHRNIFAWYFVITMLVSGGLIPLYMTISKLKLIGKIWALILPTALPVYNMILLLNFFQTIPKEIEEAACIDGAGHWTIMMRFYVPLSAPCIATLVLFATVFHWNSWFDGLIYTNNPDSMPLQSYLQTVVVERDLALMATTDLDSIANVTDRTTKTAQICLGALPILCVYPFLQRYFTTGIVLGGVKG